MALGASKLLTSRQGTAGTSPDYAELLDANGVVLEAWGSSATSVGTVELLDSADPSSGFANCVDPSGTRIGFVGRLKVVVRDVLPYVKVRLTPTSGLWTVRVTPIEASGASRPVTPVAAGATRAEAVASTATLALAAAGANVRHVLGGVGWGFSAAPAAGATVTISEGGTVYHRFPVSAAGPGSVLWPDESYSPDTQLDIALTGAGPGVTAYVEALGHRLESS